MRRLRQDPEHKKRNGSKFLPGFRYLDRFGLMKEIQISATPLLLLFLALPACEGNSVTALAKLAPVPANTRVAEGENCLYNVFADDLVCWGVIGDWGDQLGVPFSSGEVSADDPATWSNTQGWSDADGYVSNGALDYPWNGKPPSAFEPHWWGYRDQTWYLDFGSVQTYDDFVLIGSAPKPRPLLPEQQPQHLWKNSAVAAPPALFAGITLTADQASRVKQFEQEFGWGVVAQNNRARQLGLSVLDSTNRRAIQLAHAQMFSNLRSVITPPQRVIFAKNQSARRAYIEQRKAELAMRRQQR